MIPSLIPPDRFVRASQQRHVLLIEIDGRRHAELTELIARLALRGPFHLIAGGEWLPDQDSLRRSVRRYTTAVYETLEYLIVGRPSTCLQLLDQLSAARSQNHPILVLDFLHLFYDPNLDLSLRQRILEQCGQHVQGLAGSKSVILFVQHVCKEEYELFFPLLSGIADEILNVEQDYASPSSQLSLLRDE